LQRINSRTQCDIKKPIELFENKAGGGGTKSGCMIANYFLDEYAREEYVQTSDAALIYASAKTSMYAEISELKMKMVARRGRKIAADASTTC